MTYNVNYTFRFFLMGMLFISFSCRKTASSNTSSNNNFSTRYKDNVFADITVVSNVAYGANTTYAGNAKTLLMDIYYPSNDTATSRPLLVLLPGGGFSAQTDKASLAEESSGIAKFGYVVACINYRCFDGSGTMNNNTLKQILLQGMQDAKASVRFFRKDAANGNTYKINSSKIFLGGHSAGSMVAAHSVYLDTVSKADSAFKSIILANGGLDGNSGNLGYSAAVTGNINLAGALLDKNYLTASSKPMLAMYGTADYIMPYNDGSLSLPNISAINVSGSNSLYNRASSVGVSKCVVYSIADGDHFSPVQTSCTTCLSIIAGFMYKLL